MASAEECEQKIEAISAEVAGMRSSSASAAVTTALGVAEWARQTKDDAAKAKARDTVLGALEMVKEAQVGALVDSLDDAQADTLLKYVFKGMELWSNNKDDARRCTMLLKLHQAIVAKSGQGSILRAMVDRKL